MERTSSYPLQRIMIVYFLLIGVAALLVGLEFVIDINDTELKENLLDNFEQYSRQEITSEAIFEPIERLRNKAVVMVIVILCVVVVVLTMFIKHITEPLQHMITVARGITAGDLSRTITIESRNELRELGNVINEMSSNIQEFILLASQCCVSGENAITGVGKSLEKAELTPAERESIQERLDQLQGDLTQLTSVIDFFNFYTLEKPDAE